MGKILVLIVISNWTALHLPAKFNFNWLVCYYHLIGQFLTILSPDWSVDVSQTERLMLKVMLSSLIKSETVTNPLSSELRRWLLCLQKTPFKYELPCIMYTILVYGSWIWTLGTSLWGGNSSWNILNKMEPVKLWRWNIVNHTWGVSTLWMMQVRLRKLFSAMYSSWSPCMRVNDSEIMDQLREIWRNSDYWQRPICQQ